MKCHKLTNQITEQKKQHITKTQNDNPGRDHEMQ